MPSKLVARCISWDGRPVYGETDIELKDCKVGDTVVLVPTEHPEGHFGCHVVVAVYENGCNPVKVPEEEVVEVLTDPEKRWYIVADYWYRTCQMHLADYRDDFDEMDRYLEGRKLLGNDNG